MDIQKSVHQTVEKLYGQTIDSSLVQLQKTKKEFKGHLTLVVFPLLKLSKKNPEQTAQEIGEYLKANNPTIADFNVIKGFLNLSISSAYWVDVLTDIHQITNFGTQKAEENSPLVIDRKSVV